MTILITGSAGHLGEALLRTLQASGAPARGLDVLPSPFTTDVGSICDPGFVRGAMAGVSAVIHTATLYANTHHAQTAPLIAAFSGVDLATVRDMKRVTCAEYLDPRDIQPSIDAAVKYGVIDHGFPAAELISAAALKPR